MAETLDRSLASARIRSGRSRLSLSQQRARWGLLLIAPWLIGFVLFKLLPILASLGISFTSFYALYPTQTRFVGLQNYARIFQDLDAGFSLFATLGLALTALPFQLLVALGFATLLNSQRLKGKNVLRALFFMPTIIPMTALVVVASGFLDPDNGWLNRLFLEPLGLPPYPGLRLFGLLLALWAVGPSFLILLGAMQGVSPELYEAARVDGAGPIYRFFAITLPSISPAIFFSLIIGLVSVFGGATLQEQSTNFSSGISAYDNYIGNVIFQNYEYGYAASLAWTFFLLMLVVVIVVFRTSRYWVHYAEEGSEP
jgi:multiple sugar transport system permease protein